MRLTCPVKVNRTRKERGGKGKQLRVGLIALPRPKQEPFDFLDALRRTSNEVMFPDANHEPATFAQCFCDDLVPRHVAIKLPEPKFAIIYRHVRVLGTAVPETPVHEYGNAFSPKNKIGLPKKGLMSSPASDAVPPEQFCKGKLGFLVAPTANAGHHLGTFGFGKNVRHRYPIEYDCSTKSAIYPGFLLSGVPTMTARSNPWLIVSHEVSGKRTQAWHAARLASIDPCPPKCSEHTGSAEHQDARLNARRTIGPRRSGRPKRTSPPRVPSASPAAV